MLRGLTPAARGSAGARSLSTNRSLVEPGSSGAAGIATGRASASPISSLPRLRSRWTQSWRLPTSGTSRCST